MLGSQITNGYPRYYWLGGFDSIPAIYTDTQFVPPVVGIVLVNQAQFSSSSTISSESSPSSSGVRTRLMMDRDRFSGYNLPTVKLDDGFEYYVVPVHPFFFNQPMIYQKPAYSVGFNTAGGHVAPIFSPDSMSMSAQPPDVAPRTVATPPVLPI